MNMNRCTERAAFLQPSVYRPRVRERSAVRDLPPQLQRTWIPKEETSDDTGKLQA